MMVLKNNTLHVAQRMNRSLEIDNRTTTTSTMLALKWVVYDIAIWWEQNFRKNLSLAEVYVVSCTLSAYASSWWAPNRNWIRFRCWIPYSVVRSKRERNLATRYSESYYGHCNWRKIYNVSQFGNLSVKQWRCTIRMCILHRGSTYFSRVNWLVGRYVIRCTYNNKMIALNMNRDQFLWFATYC